MDVKLTVGTIEFNLDPQSLAAVIYSLDESGISAAPLLEILAGYPSRSVRENVARAEHLPKPAWKPLLSDADPIVASAAVGNRSRMAELTAKEALEIFSANSWLLHEGSSYLSEIYDNPDSEEVDLVELTKLIANQDDVSLLLQIVSWQGSKKLLKALSRHKNVLVSAKAKATLSS